MDASDEILHFRFQKDVVGGTLVVRPISAEWVEDTAHLLADCFADSYAANMKAYRYALKPRAFLLRELRAYLSRHADMAPYTLVLVALLRRAAGQGGGGGGGGASGAGSLRATSTDGGAALREVSSAPQLAGGSTSSGSLASMGGSHGVGVMEGAAAGAHSLSTGSLASLGGSHSAGVMGGAAAGAHSLSTGSLASLGSDDISTPRAAARHLVGAVAGAVAGVHSHSLSTGSLASLGSGSSGGGVARGAHLRSQSTGDLAGIHAPPAADTAEPRASGHSSAAHGSGLPGPAHPAAPGGRKHGHHAGAFGHVKDVLRHPLAALRHHNHDHSHSHSPRYADSKAAHASGQGDHAASGKATHPPQAGGHSGGHGAAAADGIHSQPHTHHGLADVLRHPLAALHRHSHGASHAERTRSAPADSVTPQQPPPAASGRGSLDSHLGAHGAHDAAGALRHRHGSGGGGSARLLAASTPSSGSLASLDQDDYGSHPAMAGAAATAGLDAAPRSTLRGHSPPAAALPPSGRGSWSTGDLVGLEGAAGAGSAGGGVHPLAASARNSLSSDTLEDFDWDAPARPLGATAGTVAVRSTGAMADLSLGELGSDEWHARAYVPAQPRPPLAPAGMPGARVHGGLAAGRSLTSLLASLAESGDEGEDEEALARAAALRRSNAHASSGNLAGLAASDDEGDEYAAAGSGMLARASAPGAQPPVRRSRSARVRSAGSLASLVESEDEGVDKSPSPPRAHARAAGGLARAGRASASTGSLASLVEGEDEGVDKSPSPPRQLRRSPKKRPQRDAGAAHVSDSGEVLVGACEVSFDEATRVHFTTLNSPANAAYLCNVAVDPAFRRRGYAKVTLEAVDQVCRLANQSDIYLHLRLVDKAVAPVYAQMGYRREAKDSVLSTLAGQERRYLLHKHLA